MELGEASRDSTGFAAMEEGLILWGADYSAASEFNSSNDSKEHR